MSVRVANVTKHPDYNARNYNNDIAVISLETDVQFTEGIRPLCLPSMTPELLEDNVSKSSYYIMSLSFHSSFNFTLIGKMPPIYLLKIMSIKKLQV